MSKPYFKNQEQFDVKGHYWIVTCNQSQYSYLMKFHRKRRVDTSRPLEGSSRNRALGRPEVRDKVSSSSSSSSSGERSRAKSSTYHRVAYRELPLVPSRKLFCPVQTSRPAAMECVLAPRIPQARGSFKAYHTASRCSHIVMERSRQQRRWHTRKQ